MQSPSLRSPWPLLLLALGACTGEPAGKGADSAGGGGGDTAAGGDVADCSPEVLVPTGSLAGDPVPAEPHAETYGAAPAPTTVHLGLPSRDPSRSVSMLWQTDAETLASVVEIGPAATWPEGATRVEGASFTFGGGVVGEGPYRQHEVRLCGALEPGTAYTYRVGGEGGWSDEHTFTTPGAPGTFDTFRVAVAGDSRGAYDTWGQLVSAMEAHGPDLYIFSGDMVELGANQSEWDAWFSATGDTFARKLVIPAHGNHEFLAQNYFVMFGMPGNEEWFAVDWGDMLVLSLNDTVGDRDHLEVDQPAFIEAELGGTQARWKIATHHQSPYSTCTRHGSDEAVREAWTPLFDAHGLDIDFAGHNHIYERSVPIRDGQEAAPGEGTTYVVTGGAGAPLYEETAAEWFGNVANPVVHYLIADFTPDGVEVVVRDLSGNVIDSWSVPR